MTLGIKQNENNDRFLWAYHNIEKVISKEKVDNRIDITVEQAKQVLKNKKVGYAWSGGKDSVALDFIMKNCGVEKCVMGLTYDLDYPEHLRFVTDFMPDGLELYDSGLTLTWLSNNIEMLFPQNSRIAGKWFKMIQHSAQDYFFYKEKLDIICLGRRKLDKNYVGTKGQNIYQNKKGITRYSPLAGWTHEEVLGLIRYYNLPHSPIYSWINGYIVGTGSWAARQWTGSIHKAWQEVYEIDPEILDFASTKIQSAKEFLQSI